MKKSTVAKIFVDIAMLVIFLQLTYGYDMSPTFHEVVGIAMGALFGVHIALNWKPIKAMFRLAAKRKLSFLKWINLIFDTVFIVAMPLCVVTGMLIARNLYIGPGDLGVSIVHTTTANIALYILIGHVVLHARYIAVYAKQTMRTRSFQRATGVAGACMLVFGLLGANVATGLSEQTYAATAATTQGTSSSTSSSSASKSVSVNDRPTRSGQTAYAATTTSTSSAASSSTSSDNSSIASSNDASADSSTVPTNCTLCKKFCPLTALECTKGVNWAESNGYI